MNEFISDSIKRIKRFLTTRDFFIFLIFLVISTVLWAMQALQKDYEATVEVPINYVNLPKDYIVTNELPTHIRLTLEGKGSNLVRYRIGNSLGPIQVDMEEVANGKRKVATSTYFGQINKQIKSETHIRRSSPDSILYVLEKQKKKTVFVALDAEIELEQQYTFSDSIQVTPAKVTAFGPQTELSKLDTIHTELLTISNVKDTITKQIGLQGIRNVRFSDTVITVTIMSEKFTEKSVQLPIAIKNVPNNCTLRIFPSATTINYQVGLSSYEKVDASSFSLYVDFNEAKKNGKDKLKVKFSKCDSKAFNVKLKPAAIDYIIEEKSVQ
ncbi:MAG: YbbR-like domain-containing protein [Paludibacteraceae bacterium]|nr:YbbR-like domain-containing protein [Paludibacteraceae bacterium]MBR5373040.1 YbbR-like domain-containing protein [Paludibacteraceae bacterium]